MFLLFSLFHLIHPCYKLLIHLFNHVFFSLLWRRYRHFSNVGVFRCDANGLIIGINELGEKILGYKQKEIQGLGLEDVTFKDDLPKELHLLNEIKQGLVPLLTRYKRYVRKDGQVFHALATLTARRSFSDCQYFGFIQQTQGDDSLLDFYPISNMSLAAFNHELRNSLQNVLSVGQYLKNRVSQEYTRHFSSLMQSADHIQHLVESFYYSNFNYPPSQNSVSRGFNLEELIDNLFVHYQSRADQKGIKLLLDKPEDCRAQVMGNDMFLQQIIHNLLTNAIHHTNEGEVSIKYALTRSIDTQQIEFNLTIKDTGKGFSGNSLSSNIPSLLAPSYPHGIGLFIVNQLIHLMHGTIQFDSSSFKGTQVTLKIPFAVSEFDKVSDQITHDLKIKSVLIIDDDELQVWWYKQLLNTLVEDVSICYSLTEASNVIKKKKFDLLLLDVSLADGDGLDFLERVLKTNESPVFKYIFVVTGYDDQTPRLIQLKQYIDQVLIKPLGQEALFKALSALD